MSSHWLKSFPYCSHQHPHTSIFAVANAHKASGYSKLNASCEQPSTMMGRTRKTPKEDTEGKRVKKQQQFSGAPAAVTTCTPPAVTQTQEEQDNVPDSTVAAIAMPMLESPHADSTAIADTAAGVINNQPRADGVERADMDFALERLVDLEKY
jgi:hypothetical protein